MRPLHDDEKLERQLRSLEGKYEKVFKETHGSPKGRVKLEELLVELKPGDEIIVEKMVSLADTSHHLYDLLKLAEKDQVSIHFLKEGIISSSTLHLHLKEIMEHLTAFQSDAIKQSTTIGMEAARKKGKSIGRPKKSDENVQKAMKMYHDGYSLHEIKKETGISKSTLYRYLESAGID